MSKEERKLTNTQDSRPALRWASVCIDCADADQMAEFYSRLLGWEITDRDTPATRQGGTGWVALRNPAAGVGLSFQAEEWYQPPVWPEQPGAQTKMLHFDIEVDDLEAAVAYVVAAGGTVAAHQPKDRARDLRVMLDPAGHPFCLFTG
jgi:catechol 2,3-dioxygenase-like lactoylglutathione lyase family enzyme